MKKINFDTDATRPVCCSTRQKVYGIIALAGLFACGVMIGVAMNGGDSGAGRRVKEMGMTALQCNDIADQITYTARGSGCRDSECAAKLRELNEVYTKNCAGRTFEVEEPKPAAKPAPKRENKADKKTCEVIEEMLLSNVADENDMNPDIHSWNIRIYSKLLENGCPENVEKYQALIQREQEILAALTGNAAPENTQTCMEIEDLLMDQMRVCRGGYDSECHISNAKVYANMSERGCPENAQKYKDMAAKELEIARALQDDDFSDTDRERISDTYRRIQMKQAAGEILNKVQKLADPAIDFIIQAQKIIEE